MVWTKFIGVGHDSKVLNRPVLQELSAAHY